MSLTISVPAQYGYTVLSTCVFSLFVVPIYMGTPVMNARKEFNVQYPNLYATPGVHKQADEFNRVQRGHQNMFESLSGFAICNLIGGLKYPLACTLFAFLYSTGCILYQQGYMDRSKDVKTARYTKHGYIKFIGLFGATGASISMAGTICGWW